MDLTSISAYSTVTAAYARPASPPLSGAEEAKTPGSDDLRQDDTRRADSKTAPGPTRADGTPLAPEEVQLLEQLKQTDRAVRQHEMAHQIAGGAYTGGASYEYETGPDGKRYAVAGEVPIDYGPVRGDPQATIEKMQTVIAAALAPADPSPKDLQIAAQARQYLLEAKLEAAQQQGIMARARGDGESDEPSSPEDAAATAPPQQAA
ncbi:hypothetical protein HW452_14610 [Halomonas aquamarina]|uniref:Uncharacterized protein n=1 Tax=Vreelandella aquamarina TaxID=77097 RepID=A0ACC5VWX2_9GAMM|nr:putative metalloprotease CJM1_0395 family protein [Halomonas aquamarina]MBZ5488756.1 hypothetical protein [Halomonas aquamarina]